MNAQKLNDKQFATLLALAAIAGFQLRRCEPDEFFLHHWNLTRFCKSLAEVESFLAQVGK